MEPLLVQAANPMVREPAHVLNGINRGLMPACIQSSQAKGAIIRELLNPAPVAVINAVAKKITIVIAHFAWRNVYTMFLPNTAMVPLALAKL